MNNTKQHQITISITADELTEKNLGDLIEEKLEQHLLEDKTTASYKYNKVSVAITVVEDADNNAQ